MSKKIIVANWKMNPVSLKEAEALLTKVANKSNFGLLALYHLQKNFLGDSNFSALLHASLAPLLLLPKLHLASSIAAIHVLGDVFAHRRQGAR